MSETKQGENCTFIFKKRCLKSRGNRKRQKSSSSETGKLFRYMCEVMLVDTKHFLGESDIDNKESAVIRPNKRRIKSNPNIQSTSTVKIPKGDNTSSSSESEDESNVTVSYKSNKSAMPEGPQDQGATAVLVRNIIL